MAIAALKITMKRRDGLTTDLFDLVAVPVARDPIAGALDVGAQLRGLLSQQLKTSVLSRHQVAARMSELLGHDVTKHQLDSWTAESRDGWRFPLEYLPALEVALETHAVTAWLADLRGARLMIGREALEAQLGKLEHFKTEIRRQEMAIKKLLEEK
ncbi:MAG: hypothetical protein PHT85_12725 [Methylovulum sp.]|nr:hypothetical protein [Methylovulum sp.]